MSERPSITCLRCFLQIFDPMAIATRLCPKCHESIPEDVAKRCTGHDEDKLVSMVTPDKLGIVGMVTPPRVGCNLFSVLLEHRHFTPRDQSLNAKFEYALVRGPDEMIFYLILVPMTYRPVVESLVKELKLRLADGVPHILGGKESWTFPANKPNVFTLENQEGSHVYGNNPKLYQLALEVERAQCEREFQKYERGL